MCAYGFTVASLDLQGAAGNMATVRSRYAGTAVPVKLTGSQTIEYADFKEIDASGGNANVKFRKVWDGGGADDNWSTVGNWEFDGELPGAADEVVFDGTSVKNCTVDIDVAVGKMDLASGYTGTVRLDGVKLEVSGSGNITVAAGTLAGTSGTPSEIVGGGKVESTGGAIDLVNEYRLSPEFACMMRVFVFS